MNNILQSIQFSDLFTSVHELTSNELYEYTAIDISPNLQYLACAGLYIDNVSVWEIGSLQLIKQMGTDTQEDVHQLQFSIDSKYLAICGSSPDLKIWDLDSQQPTILQGHELGIWRIHFFHEPYSKLICSGSEDGTLKVWNVVNKQLLQTFIQIGTIYSVMIDPKNNFLLIAGVECSLLYWHYQRPKKVIHFTLSDHYCAKFPHHTCLFFAITGNDDYVRIVSKNKLMRKLMFKENWKWEIEFTKKSLLIVASMYSIQIWNCEKGTLLKKIENDFYTYPSMKFQYIEDGVCATTVKQLIKLWIK